MIGVGALVGGIIALSFFMSINFYILLPVTVLIGGLTGWARLKLNAHTPAQVYAGFMLGAVVIFSLLTWYSS